LSHRLLLLGDLQRLDREIGLLGAVEADDHRIELLSDLKALRTLLVAIAAEVAALDEAGRSVVADLDIQTGVLDRPDRDGQGFALLDSADCGRTAARASRGAGAATFELLDAERNALLLYINVEDLRLERFALAVKLKRFLARNAPRDVGHVDHAVDIAFEADEQPELGGVLDFALDGGADGVFLGKGRPRILLRLLEAERNPPLLFVDLEHLHVDFLAGRNDLARVHVLLGPAHLRDVDQALDARLEFNERTVFGNVGHSAAEHALDRVLGGRALPGIAFQLLHAEADALRIAVDADNLDLHRVANVEHLGRVVDALVG